MLSASVTACMTDGSLLPTLDPERFLMNTLVFFFILVAVIEILVIGGTALILRKSDNVVLAVLGVFSVFIAVWWIASTQVDIHDAAAFSQMAYYKIIGLIVAIAGLAVIYRRQNQRAHH